MRVPEEALIKQTKPPSEFVAAVHQALQNYLKGASAANPLAGLVVVRRTASSGNVHRAGNQVLLAALERLALTHQADADLLRARFLEGKTVAAVARERNLAEVTVYKMQRKAIERLAETLFGIEQDAVAERQQVLARRLPPATYDRLFGVEAHLRALRSLLFAPDGPDLVSIEGLGGIGKTALAHRLLRDMAQYGGPFADFGWVSAQQRFFVPAEGIRTRQEPALTADALVEALVTQLMAGEVARAPGTPAKALSALEARLRQIPHLIVVDNLETVADVESLLPLLARLAGPTRFLLTSRETFHEQAGVYHFPVPELDEGAALELVRHEARLHNLPHVAEADDDALRPIYATVGGNPLALQLVTGQLQILPLSQVLDDLRQARGRRAEELYNFIYWHAWHRLPASAQEVLLLMPHFAHTGADLSALQRICDLDRETLTDALTYLVRLSLVNVSGDLQTRRYSIHRLTESFLLNEVIKWRGQWD
ncbi:MAG: NB-ARC domain-containing protein [Anaerolineae bacterium]|nr:NB-ARC domain-containing protein [Anaerolineae bacterium]